MKKIYLPLLGAAMSMSALAETQESWALLQGPDGKTWSVNTVADLFNKGNEYYDDFVYNSLEVTLSDASHQVKGTFTIDVNGLGANDVQVFGPVTSHLFNADDDLELGVEIHVPGNYENGYQSKYYFRAYSLSGQQVMEAEGNGVIVADSQNPTLIISSTVDDGTLYGQNQLKFYQNDGNALTLAKTISMGNELLEYMSGSVLNTVELSDGTHYIISHYEKSLALTNEYGEPIYDPSTWMPMWTPDNNFIIENYNQNLEKVDEVKVSTQNPEGIMIRMMGVGLLTEKNVTEGYFTGDGQYNYVIIFNDMNEYWMEEYAFEVYSQGNTHVGTLCQNVGGFWNHLTSIDGEEDQWLFLQSDMMTGMEQLSLVEVPSLSQVAVIPSEIDGKLISSNIDRFADATGYKYVIGLNEPDTDADNNVIAQYGIYNQDFTVDRYVQFNMGPDAETFTPLLNNESLDPHLFYADDQREFIFLAKVKGQDGYLYNTLFIGNEEGEVLNTYSGDGTTKGDIFNVAILNYGTDQPELFISYYDLENDVYTNEFISLPLSGTVGVKQITTSSAIQTYNLQGQRNATSASGLFIANGKVMFKK